MKKTILLKISGELFASEHSAIDLEKVRAVAEEISKIAKDYNLGIVMGGGNVFRGRSVKSLDINMAAAHYIGIVGTIPNCLALKTIFTAMNVEARVISSLSLPDVIGSASRFDIPKYFALGEILIFAAGTGSPFVTTDTGAVIRALEIKADILLKASNVRGVYSADPVKYPDAVQYKQLKYGEYLRVSDAHVLDRTAAVMAAENALPIYVFQWDKNALRHAVRLKAGGTLIN